MNRIAFACLWLFVFTIPWEMSLQLGAGIGSIGRVAGLIALVAAVWAVGANGRLRRLSAFHISAIAFLLLVSASLFWTADPIQSPHIIRVYYQSMWVSWIVWEVARDERRLSQLRMAFVLGECVLVSLTLQSFLNGRIAERAKEARFAAEGWNWNDMAIMLVLGIPFACFMAVKSENLWERWLGRISLFLAVLGIILTSSRTGLVGIAVAFLTLPLLKPRSSTATKLLAVPLVAAAVYAAVLWLPAQTFQRLGTTLGEITYGTMDFRTSIWKVGLLAFPEHWLVGVGAGAWIAGTGNFYNAHNMYLEILVEDGIAGFVLYLLILWFVIGAIRRNRAADRLVSVMLLIAFLVCAIAGHWAQMPATWFVLGWIVARGHVENPVHTASRQDEVTAPMAGNEPAVVNSGWL
jgi:hypothetical protein